MSRTATSPFDIKSATIQGLSLVLRSAALEVIEAELVVRVASAGDLFTHMPVLINVAALTADGTADALELEQLIILLHSHSLRAVGIVGASGPLLSQAQALGLTEEEDIQPRARRSMPAPTDSAESVDAAQGTGQTDGLADATNAADTPASAPANPERTTIAPASQAQQVAVTRVIERSVRSGQRIYARGGDLVVLGVVNHGAEVIADGNIHVYGPLRGRAIAGATGDTDARIFAAAMEPELVAIAGTYRTTDKPLDADVLGKPAQIRLHDDKLLIEPLKN